MKACKAKPPNMKYLELVIRDMMGKNNGLRLRRDSSTVYRRPRKTFPRKWNLSWELKDEKDLLIQRVDKECFHIEKWGMSLYKNHGAERACCVCKPQRKPVWMGSWVGETKGLGDVAELVKAKECRLCEPRERRSIFIPSITP